MKLSKKRPFKTIFKNNDFSSFKLKEDYLSDCEICEKKLIKNDSVQNIYWPEIIGNRKFVKVVLVHSDCKLKNESIS